jgi:hypothetical protein
MKSTDRQAARERQRRVEGFRERLGRVDDPKYDLAITETVRIEEVHILDENLALALDSR